MHPLKYPIQTGVLHFRVTMILMAATALNLLSCQSAHHDLHPASPMAVSPDQSSTLPDKNDLLSFVTANTNWYQKTQTLSNGIISISKRLMISNETGDMAGFTGNAFISSKTLYPTFINPLSTTPSWVTNGGQSDLFANKMESAGDVNGDGYDDVIISAYIRGQNAEQFEGSAQVHLGGPGGLQTATSWYLEGNDYLMSFGSSVSSAGDVNGDGFDDVIVGAYGGGANYIYRGKAMLYYGSSAGLSTTPAWTAISQQDRGYYGWSVASADVNNDGYSDVLIGAPQYDSVGANTGKVEAYYGSASGLPNLPNWKAKSNNGGSLFGYSLSSAGDVNGDGYGDVIIGAHLHDNPALGYNTAGKIFVYHGSATGLEAAPAREIIGTIESQGIGYKVSGAGDVNGDGYSDVLVGVFQYSNGQNNEGAVYLYHGSATGVRPTPARVIEGNEAEALFGWSFAAAGDINSDGFDDVIIGAPKATQGFPSAGKAFIYFGKAAGLQTTPAWTTFGTQNSHQFGNSVAAAGDVNGDGSPDILVGAYLTNVLAGVQRGYAYLFTGGSITLPLKLNSFSYTCSGNNPRLGWQTDQEHNVQSFIIQQSSDGANWNNIGNVTARGNTSHSTDYQFIIPAATTPSQYRLRMVDMDGSFTYSSILVVKNACTDKTFTWNISPNPVSPGKAVQISFTNYPYGSSPVQMALTNSQGQSQALGTVQIPAATTLFVTDAGLPAGLAAGIYTVTLRNTHFKESKRILIRK